MTLTLAPILPVPRYPHDRSNELTEGNLADLALLCGAIQKTSELIPLIKLLREHDLKSVLEIGVARGGRNMKPPNQKWHFLYEDSHRAETRSCVVNLLQGGAVDLLFIDGDHSFGGVKTDFDLYAPLVRPGGKVVFHDIVRHVDHPHVQVDRFWAELKVNYEHVEFVDATHDAGWGPWGGIGVISIPS